MTKFVKFPGSDRFVNINHIQWFEAFEDVPQEHYKSKIWLSPSPDATPVDSPYRSYFFSTETPDRLAEILNRFEQSH